VPLKKIVGPSTVTQELKGLLEDNDWWLRAGTRTQDLRVARPRVRRAVVLPRHLRVAAGRAVGTEALPPCPTCLTSDRVGVHCWRGNHAGCRVVALDTHYFAISRRYLCHGFEDAAAAV